MENKEIDKQKTIEIDNKLLQDALDLFNKDKKPETFNALLQVLVNARVLVSSRLEEVDGKKVPMPLAFANKEGQLFQPVYTDKAHLEKGIKSEGVTNTDFLTVANMVVNQNKMIAEKKMTMKPVMGIVINPQTDNTVFNTKLIEEILKNTKKNVRLTEAQYVIYERNKFEQITLPGLFFEKGRDFVNEVANKKEEYIDSLFEESYENKRMYPHLVEDFKVLPITMAQGIDVVRINMPEADLKPGMCEAIFLAWDANRNKGNYYAMVMDTKNGGDRNRVMIEVTGPKQAAMLGVAPDEGIELNWVLNRMTD